MRKVRNFTPKDAEGLAKCINQSEGGWPGGISGGMEHTAQHILDDYEREAKLTWLIAVTEEDEVAGISTLTPHFDDPEAAYLGFLNVSDAFRKRGYGKALLIESVKQVVDKGYKRLFLHTWAGNLNAVPAYKRTGFFWRPDTQVLMENYIPTVLKLPITQPYFTKHNWYETFERQIEIVPDDMTHRGLPIYDLRWSANGENLRVLIDRESRGPTLIETDELQVECWITDPEPPLGVPFVVEWTIQNKQKATPLQGTLKVTLPEGVDLIECPPGEFVVQPEATLTLKGTIQAKVSVVPPAESQKALAINSKFTLGNLPIDLMTGIRVKHPIQISTVPTSLRCRPGNKLNLAIAIKSNLKSPAQGTVFLEAPEELQIEKQQFKIALKSEDYSGIEVPVKVDENIATKALLIKLYAKLRLEDHQLTTRTETIHLHCMSTGGVLVTAFDDNKRLQIHTETLSFSINLSKGAHIDRLENALTQRQHLRSHFRNSLGPPFWPSEQMQTHFQHSIHHRVDGTTRIVTWMECQRYPGLTFTKTFVLNSGSSLLQVEYAFENVHPSNTYQLRLTTGSIAGIWDHLHVLPLKEGLLREECVEDEFFATSREIPKEREEWLETWYCAERPHTGDVTAIMCDPSVFYEADGYTFLNFQLQIPPLPPKKKVTLPPMSLYTGLGTWRHVRQLWHQLYDSQPSQLIPELQPSRAIDVQTADFPALLEIARKIIMPVHLRHLVQRPLEGTLKFSAPIQWTVTPRSYKFKGVTRTQPLLVPLTLTAHPHSRPEPSVLPLKATVRTRARDYQFTLPVILHRRPGSVTLSTAQEENQEIHTIDNGAYLLKIAPEFAGTIIGLINKTTKTNYLESSFPKAGPKVWRNPWYGGIRFDPFAPKHPGWFPTKLDKERWRAKEIHRGTWSGVTLSTQPRKIERKLKGFRLELQVLTQPFSNIVALVSRVINRSSAPRQINHRLRISFPSEGDPKGLETIIPRQVTELHRRRVSTHSWPTATQPYLGIEHLKDDMTAIFVSKLSVKGELFVGDLGKDSIWINTEELLDVNPKGTVERTSFLVISDQPWKEAKAYAVLANLSL
ncbi:MAG: GNAT family N-acetyltransferase [Promethearchaeota archaeon]